MNLTIQSGYLGHTPELKYTSTGVAVTSFNLGVRRPYKTKEGEYITDWFKVIAWRDKAELICKTLKKGSFVIVEGCLQTQEYINNDGNKIKNTEIIVNNIDFGNGSKPSNTIDSAADNEYEETIGFSDDMLPF